MRCTEEYRNSGMTGCSVLFHRLLDGIATFRLAKILFRVSLAPLGIKMEEFFA